MRKDKADTNRSVALRWTRWALVLLVVASFAIYLHNLGEKSLWSDEGLTFRRADQPLGQIFRNLNLVPAGPRYFDETVGDTALIETPDLHPPLYFLFMHFWIQIAGQSEFALRFPSALAATLALPLFYALGRALLSREAGLWAALLAAFSPFYLWYAQEARMYAWVVVLSLASVYTFLPLLETTARRRSYFMFTGITLVLLYTHYMGFILLAFEILVYGLYLLRTRSRRAVIVVVLLAAALVPLVPYIVRTLQLPRLHAFSHRTLSHVLAEVGSSFSLGLGESFVRPLEQVAPFLILAALGVLMAGVPQRLRAWVICLGYLAIPILLLDAISYVRPNYMNPRHMMMISPAWELLMAQGLATLRRRFWPGLIVLLGLVLFLRGQADYTIFTAHSFWKDNYRDAVTYIENRARPGDAVVLHHAVTHLTFDYYYDGPYPEVAIPSYHNTSNTARALAEFTEWSQRYDRIWFVYGPPPTHFPQEFLPDWADDQLFKVYEEGFESWWTYVAVAAYDDGPPLHNALPEGAESLDHNWGPLRLVGFENEPIVAGENGWLYFYWQVDGEPPEGPLTLAIRLRDAAGTVWFERIAGVLPFYPPSQWPADQLIQTEFRLPLPNDLPPTAFNVELEPVGWGEPVVAGPIIVSRPVVREPALRTQARFEGGLELLESALFGDRFSAGHSLVGSLTWRATTAPDADYQIRIRLTDLWGREVATTDLAPSAADFPTRSWLPDDRIAGLLALPLPADLDSGLYRLQVGLVDAADGTITPVHRWYGEQDWVTIDTVRVDAWPLVTEIPADVTRRVEDVQLDQTIHLRGYDLAQATDTLTLTLYWQSETDFDAFYLTFVHLGAPDVQPVAQADGIPGEWLRPTTTWRAGEIIADTHTLSLDEVPSGRYNLSVGLYDPGPDGQRAIVVVNGESIPGRFVLLQEIEVER